VNQKLLDLKAKIERLSPAARLLMASELVKRGDFDAVDLGMTIAARTVDEWEAAKRLASQTRNR
jgi:hypothetical protein